MLRFKLEGHKAKKLEFLRANEVSELYEDMKRQNTLSMRRNLVEHPVAA